MCVRIQMPLVVWVGSCRDTRLVEWSSPGAGVSPFPASACIHVQNYVLQVIPSAVVGLRDTGCMGPEPLF